MHICIHKMILSHFSNNAIRTRVDDMYVRDGRIRILFNSSQNFSIELVKMNLLLASNLRYLPHKKSLFNPTTPTVSSGGAYE